MDSFQTVVNSGNWDLNLPLTVHGVTITAEMLDQNAPPRQLTLTRPYMTGTDVAAVQTKLGVANADGVYGPQADALVKQFQARNGITGENGVGPVTRQKLGL